MDSLLFMHLCFLLLTLSFPLLTTAMPSGNPAEETKGSIKVTAYDCKHCDISVCEFSNFSCCAVIGETQNKIFSNEVIQLVTDETYVTMCFQQAYTFPEGIYAIIWAKAEGIGDSCGILKAEAFPENREDIIAGWRTCCTAQIQLTVPSSSLHCYTELPGEKDKGSLLRIFTDSSSSSVSKQDTFGIITMFVVFVGCAVVLDCS